jgi:hypothetical protein
MQTAVEWLIENINKYIGGRSMSDQDFDDLDRIANEAFAMEKEQIKNAYQEGNYNTHTAYAGSEDQYNYLDPDAEEYYNQTYKP